MGMIIQVGVGPQTAASGTNPNARGGLTGELVVTELHGKYYEQTRNGKCFTATMTAGVVNNNTAGTSSPFAVANPTGSGVNASLIHFDMVITALPGTPVVGAYVLAVNTNTAAAAVTGTALTPFGRLGQNDKSACNVFTTVTLPANPTIYRLLATKLTGAATTIPDMPAFFCDFDGVSILTPGTSICVQQVTGDTTDATVMCTMIWEEN